MGARLPIRNGWTLQSFVDRTEEHCCHTGNTYGGHHATVSLRGLVGPGPGFSARL